MSWIRLAKNQTGTPPQEAGFSYLYIDETTGEFVFQNESGDQVEVSDQGGGGASSVSELTAIFVL